MPVCKQTRTCQVSTYHAYAVYNENSENFVPQPTSGKAFKDMFEIVIDEFVHKCKQDILPTYDV
jgi:hypothetical protein